MLLTPTLVAALLVHGPTASHGAHDHAGAGPHLRPQDTWERPAPPAEPLLLGTDQVRYRWNADWLQLPEGRDWLGSTHGCIVVDARDRVYLSADSGDAVLVFAPDGTLERSFGTELGAGLHGISIETESVDVAPDTIEEREREVLYLAHTARQEVLKTTLEGEVLLRIGLPTASGKYEDPGRYRPTSVAVAPDGTIFVADGYGLSWIHRFDAAGTYLDSFGGPGEGPENLRTPHGLWLDLPAGERAARLLRRAGAGDAAAATLLGGTLLVADRENHRIARFSLTGEFLGATDPDSGLLRRPCHLQFQGGLFCVSDLAGRVTLLDAELELVAHLGDNPDTGQHANFHVAPNDWRHGAFTAPHCARFDGQGNLYVMDWNVAGRVTKLERLREE